jgi:hypothetical protein
MRRSFCTLLPAKKLWAITCCFSAYIFTETCPLNTSFPRFSSTVQYKTHKSIMWHTGNIYLITAIAVIGGGLFGFDISSMSAIISTQPHLCYFNQGPDGPGFNNNPLCSGPKSNTQGGITASMAGGSWLGALISGYLTDRVGRKRAIQIGSLFWYETRLFSSSR